MEHSRNTTSVPQDVNHEAEATLLRRLESLERLVFGRTSPAERLVQELGAKVEAIEKSVRRAEGGNQDIKDLGVQASCLDLLPSAPSSSSPVVVDNVNLKESIVLAARGEIEATASVLGQAKALEEHVNPPYLRDIPQLSAKLRRLEGMYAGQAAEAAWINERAEKARLHYSQAVTLISEKFVHWDDQVAEFERQRAPPPGGQAPATAP